MTPSAMPVIAALLAIVWGLSATVGKPQTEAEAIRRLDRIAAVVVTGFLVAIALAHVFFFAIPLESWSSTDELSLWPLPLADISVEVTPMERG
jgi:hypothetical protein